PPSPFYEVLPDPFIATTWEAKSTFVTMAAQFRPGYELRIKRKQ
ncbi:10912_t:CDS:1, partial [Racocetra fulgida]